MHFFKKWHKHSKRVKNEYHKNYQQTEHNMTFESKLLAGLSMLSFFGSAILLAMILFGVINSRILIMFVLLVILFVITSMRMIKLIAKHEDANENHKL